MASLECSNLPGMGSVELIEDAIRRRVIDLRLDKVNKSGEIRPAGVMDNGVDTQTTVRTISDGMVAADFTLVKVISFRQSA
jgi:hypothetical protein